MQISWVFASGYSLDPTVEIDKIKNIGPTWGSWKTWRSCNTDNVTCHDRVKAQELLRRAFQAVCNFYVSKTFYQDLGRPIGVKLYEGDFDMQVDDLEDIISMHLAGSQSDIVLLLGYDLGKLPNVSDDFERHKLRNYHGLIRSTINNHPNTQWVLVDHPESLDPAYQNLSNLTCDTMKNALQLLL